MGGVYLSRFIKISVQNTVITFISLKMRLYTNDIQLSIF